MMKTMGWSTNGLVLGLILASGIMVKPAAAIKVGDTTEVVFQELGHPQGRISSGIYDIYLYDRGKVELKNGLVSEIELVSPEEAAARRVEKEKRQQEAQRQAQEAQERRRKEGNQLLANRLADTTFRAQSATDQLAFWDLFKAQYPEIDIGSIYATVYRQYQVEEEQARVREQLADLRQRTAAAEARALRAEQAAENAAYWARPTVTYVPIPWIQSYPRYCPPVSSFPSPHLHPNRYDTPDTSDVQPFSVTHFGTIPLSTRKIVSINDINPGRSICRTNTTINGKSGLIFRP